MNITLKPEIVKGLRGNKPIPAAAIAKKLKITEEEYLDIENNGKDVDISVAQTLAMLYGRNWSVFLLNEAPAKPTYDEDHRTVNNTEAVIGYRTYEALEEADYLIDFVTDITEDKSNKIPVFNTSMSPRSMANQFRDETGYAVEKQPLFINTAEAIKYWTAKLSELGINVSSRQLGENDGVRAFSLYRRSRAMIVLNTDETDNGKIFSLMHELGHILLRNTGVCDLSRSKIENYCNQFASEVLIPNQLFDELMVKYEAVEENAEEVSRKIARRLRVSALAVLTRLLQENIISATTYDKLSAEEYKKFNLHRQQKKDSQERAKERAKQQGKSAAINQYVVNRARIGNLFLGELFSAFNSGRITPFEASKYLGFKPQTISKFSEWATHGDIQQWPNKSI